MATNLELIKREQNNIHTHLTSKVLNTPLSYTILLGYRDIGKTFYIYKQLYLKNKPYDGVFIVLTRNDKRKKYLAETVAGYGEVIFGGKGWYSKGNSVYDNETGKIIARIVSFAETEHIKQERPPYIITDVFLDECYTFTPYPNEFQKIQILLPSLIKKQEVGKKSITLWSAGNEGMGGSPLIENIKVNVTMRKFIGEIDIPGVDMNGRPTKVKAGLSFYNSDLPSPDGIVNVSYPFLKIRNTNKDPLITWGYGGRGYGLFAFERDLHLKEIEGQHTPLNNDIISTIKKCIFAPNINPIQPLTVESVKCNHLFSIIKIYKL